MIRGNLATRPFYNERGAQALIALFALLVLALTAFNIYRIVSLSAHNTALGSEIRGDGETAARLRREAAALRARINQDELQVVMAGAREANTLIDQRTFSWTEFFNLIERTLPENVMLASVTPSVESDRTVVDMTVLGRGAEDIDAFMEQLEATHAFHDVLPRNEDVTEEGLHRLELRAGYVPPRSGSVTPVGGGATAPTPR